jgi:hypothetical protein
MNTRALIIPSLLLLGIGCGGGGSEPPPEYPAIEPPPTTTEPPTETVAEPEPPPPPVQVVPGESTPVEGQTPSLRITAPRANQLVRTGDVMLRVQLRNWELEPDPGRHVHLIIDNEPYIALRDVSQPINVNQVFRENHGRDLAEGTHVIRMFPSRSHHESVKDAGAFAMVVFHFRSRSEGFEFDPRAPLLTYSRPKGCNQAGSRVLLDFFVTNVPALAADGTRVHYTVDDVSGDATSWVPHYIENLQPGSHSIHLQLVGADGAPIAGLFNDTTREITVQAQCPPPPAPPPAPAPEPAAN